MTGDELLKTYEQIEQEIIQWNALVVAQLKSKVTKGSGNLAQTIKSKVRKKYGVPESANIVFNRYGVFLEKGAGKGYKVTQGSLTRTAKTAMVKKRQQQPWFNETINSNIDTLANKVTEHMADLVVDVSRILIK